MHWELWELKKVENNYFLNGAKIWNFGLVRKLTEIVNINDQKDSKLIQTLILSIKIDKKAVGKGPDPVWRWFGVRRLKFGDPRNWDHVRKLTEIVNKLL